MAYEIYRPDDYDCIVVRWFAAISAADVPDVSAAVAELLAENGLSSLLFDIRELRMEPAIFELFNWASESGKSVPQQTRIAIIGRPDQAENLSFVSIVAQNRGKTLEVFTEEETALSWLSKRKGA